MKPKTAREPARATKPATFRPPRRSPPSQSSATRRARLRQRTPKWADRSAIGALYEEAQRLTKETGVPHHVDHQYPLAGAHVSGLHVHQNLRVLPATANKQKHNKMPEVHS